MKNGEKLSGKWKGEKGTTKDKESVILSFVCYCYRFSSFNSAQNEYTIHIWYENEKFFNSNQ